MPRLLLAVAAAFVAAFVVWVYRPKPVTVEVASVARGELRYSVEETGRTVARRTWLVSAPVAGRLHRINLEPGDAVAAGETVLAVLSPAAPPLLDERARGVAEARVKEAAAALRKAEGGVTRARSAARLAQDELSRALALSADQAITPQELARRKAEAASAAAALEEAKAFFDMARYERETALAQLAGAAGGAGGEATYVIRAPTDGIVLQVLVETEAQVAAGAQLLEIGTPQDMEVNVDVVSSDAVRIEPGQPAVLSRWGGGRSLSGRVRRVSPKAFTKVSALGVEEQRVSVRVALAEPPTAWAGLGIGYALDVTIILEEVERALVVPKDALVHEADAWSVYTVEDGRASRRVVEIRGQDAEGAEVLAGLAEGERVILHPGERIAEGTRVRVHEPATIPAH